MGIIASFYDQSYPPKSKFVPDEHIPDLSGQVVIVTGANTGVGKETAKELLKHNAKVYVATRSAEKAAAAIKDLQSETGKEALFLQLDLANLKAIKKAAEEFNSKEKELHVLFNNGGVMTPPVRDITSDGYDLQFGTNVLGHFYFTTLLLPNLTAAAKSSGKPSRVINTSSSMHMIAKTLDFDTFKDGPKRVKLGTTGLYAQSKLGNVVFSNELARRYSDQGIISVSLNPGNLKTDLQRHRTSLERTLMNWMLHPAPYGALTQLWAGTTSDPEALNGKYLIPWARLGKSQPVGEDPALGKKLWEWLEEQVTTV
ncbi:hypothetical protein HGRIS_006397 [Hohenbuehelia grisea]|uniref:NAD(P)-binding protein n=1 Tax=Hohenbuehelia grisea TaxID=104357 RepID=A0ABR3K028_9AGAR